MVKGTFMTKVRRQQNKLYSAEQVLDNTYNLIPNLREINSATFTDRQPNPNFRLIVDQTGVISAIQENKFKIHEIDEYDIERPDNFNNRVDNYRQIITYKAKNPNRLPKDKVNKLVNAQVKRTIYTKAFYKKYFGNSQPKITCEGDTGSCWYHRDNNSITLKNWASDYVILHELAHQRSEKHGRIFATNYLLLVGRFMDHGQQAKLIHSFKKWGVEYNGTFRHTNRCLLDNGITDPEILNKGYNNDKRCSQGATKHFHITTRQLRYES